MKTQVFFFGVYSVSNKGHYLYPSSEQYLSDINSIFPFHINSIFPFHINSLDGILKNTKQSACVLWRFCDWTLITFPDYSGDSRPGSNGSFIARGNHSFTEILALAQEAFPEQFKRINDKAEFTLAYDDRVLSG